MEVRFLVFLLKGGQRFTLLVGDSINVDVNMFEFVRQKRKTGALIWLERFVI